MRKYLFVFCTIGALVSCSSVPKKQDNKSSQVVEKYEKKMRDIAGAFPSGKSSVRANQNPYLQNVDLTIVGPDGDVILFYKDGNNIVIQECEPNKINVRQDCKAKGVARTTPVEEFKKRLKIALRVGTFDTMSSDNKKKLEGFREGEKRTPTPQEILDQQKEVGEKITGFENFIAGYPNEKLSDNQVKELADLRKLKADLDTRISQNKTYGAIVVEINKLIDHLVDEVIGSSAMTTYQNSANMGDIEFGVLRSYVRPFLMDAAYVTVKAGTFQMGSASSESDRGSDERQHQVTLTKDFEMGQTEVTQLQWALKMGSNPSRFKDESYCPESYMPDVNGVAVCAELPVERVSWNDIQTFITAYNRDTKDGYKYRLPTEAEWEYAARAGSQTAYSFGDNSSMLGDNAWYTDNSNGQTHSIATKQPNQFGLHDMHGNVWEWVEDTYLENYERLSGPNPVNCPKNDSLKIAPYTQNCDKSSYNGSFRVLRGGGWGSGARRLRSAGRSSVAPDFSYGFVGFRLVRAK